MAASYNVSPIIKRPAPAHVHLAVFRKEAKCVRVPAYGPPVQPIPLLYELPCQACKPVLLEPSMGTFVGGIFKSFPDASPNAAEKVERLKVQPSQLDGLQSSNFFLPSDREVALPPSHSRVEALNAVEHD